MPLAESHPWTFTVATPAGEVHSTYLLTATALEFDSDALWDGGHVDLPLAVIKEAGTAMLDLPVGPGAPDLGRFVPRNLEWLVAARSDGARPFMRPLPPPPDREALIAAVRERLGGRWTGERIPLAEARQRFGLPAGGGENLKAAGIVVGVLALLVLLLVLLMLLLSPIVLFPAGFALGAWLFRNGLTGLRDAISVANTPTARVASAAIGLVELEGMAKSDHPTPAAASGRLSAWWDVVVESWVRDDDRGGNWQQLAARHGGTMDSFVVEDPTGRVLVWTKGADLLLAEDCWEADKAELPPAGAALMKELGFAWRGRMRVRETRVEVEAPIYVLGTLDERRTIPAGGEAGLVARLTTMARSGEWRTVLIRKLPRWLGLLVAVLSGFLSIVTGVGRGGERVKGAQDSSPPDLPPDAVLVWKGRGGRPFIVSNRREEQALSQLRTRSLYLCAGGIAVLCYCVVQLFEYF